MLSVNKTLQRLDVSNNSFGKMQKGDQVKLKSSEEMCTLTMLPDSRNDVRVTLADGSQSDYMKWNLFEFDTCGVPLFCAGVAASQSLLWVSSFWHPQCSWTHTAIAFCFERSSMFLNATWVQRVEWPWLHVLLITAPLRL